MKEERGGYEVVYVLGTSYSGSTLLGYVLGSSPRITTLGELKFYHRQIKKGFFCSCGKEVRACPFWSKHIHEDYRIYELPTVFEKIKILFKIISGIKFETEKIEKSDDIDLLEELYRSLDVKSKHYFLDNSKSLWRLIHLMKLKDMKIKIIYMKRGIHSNVSSFIKHGKGFLEGAFIYKFKNYLIRRFLKTNDLNFVKIDYESFCKDTASEVKKVRESLGVKFKDYHKGMKKTNYHVAFGNQGVQKQFMEGFKGIKYDDSWKKRLSKLQKKILGIIG